MATLDTLIAEHRFTRELNPRYLHLLCECATYEQFGAGQVIFQEGGEADRFFLIQSGLVALQTFAPGQGMMTIQTIGVGEALGWSWLVPPYRWHFTAVAMEPIEAISLWAPTLRDRMEENHDFGYAIWTRMGSVMLERLQSTRLRLLEPYGVPG